MHVLHSSRFTLHLPSCLLISRPMPELPPVTRATCGSRVPRQQQQQRKYATYLITNANTDNCTRTLFDSASERKGDVVMVRDYDLARPLLPADTRSSTKID